MHFPLLCQITWVSSRNFSPLFTSHPRPKPQQQLHPPASFWAESQCLGFYFHFGLFFLDVVNPTVETQDSTQLHSTKPARWINQGGSEKNIFHHVDFSGQKKIILRNFPHWQNWQRLSRGESCAIKSSDIRPTPSLCEGKGNIDLMVLWCMDIWIW